MRRLVVTLLVTGLVATAAAQETSRPNGHADRDHLFKQVDQNGDGRINREESSAVEGFDFVAADTNDDRMLTRQEFATALDALASRAEAKSSLAASGADSMTFREADKNGDGKIDLEEANAIDGFDFSAADADHDLEISRTEFRTALAELRSRG
jgi:Ca2+-binding EF-hand superfamily protein